MLRFNFDAQAGETPASIAQKRALVAQIMGTARTPQTFGEGLSALGDGIVANVLGGRAADAEKAGQSSANDTFSQLVASITGQGGAPIPTRPATATDATAALAAVPSGERAAYIRSGLVNRGLPEHVADAFLLNMQDESGLDPGINEAQPLVPGSRGGYGLYQLTGPRRTAYEAFAGERGVDPSDIDAQLDFLMTELQGPEANAYRSIMSAQDTPTAAAAIVNEFLRPAEVNRARREASYLGGQSQLPELSALMEAASNPWLSDSQKSVINSMIAQQMQAADPAYQQSLRAGDLGIQKAELELEALRNPAKRPPIEVGGVLVDPDTFQPVFDSRTAEAPPRPLTQEERAAWGIPADDETPYALVDGLPKPLQSGPLVQIAGGEKSYDQTVGKGYGEKFLDLQNQAASAQGALNSFDIMEQALSQPGFYSGFGADQVAALKRFGNMLGFDAEGIESMEAFNAMTKDAALDAMGGSLGTGFSNADRDFVIDQVANLGNTPQGNAALIRIQRKISQRKIEMADQARLYAQQHDGRIDAGFDDFMRQWAQENPLFDGTELGTQPEGTPPPPAGQPATSDIDDILKGYGL